MDDKGSEVVFMIADRLRVPNLAEPALSKVRRKYATLKQLGLDEFIPNNGVIFDVGCGDGSLGVAIAQEHRCKLAQADIVDRRREPNKFDYLSLPNDDSFNLPPDWREFADVVLLIDVLQHISSSKMDPKKAKRVFLERIASSLKKDGRIVIAFTHPSADSLLSDKGFWLDLKQSSIGDRIILLKSKNGHI